MEREIYILLISKDCFNEVFKMKLKHKYKLCDCMFFGKHEGQQIEDIIEDDPNYITWMYESGFSFDDESIALMEDKKII